MSLPKLKKSFMFKLIATLIVFSVVANYTIRQSRLVENIYFFDYKKSNVYVNNADFVLKPTDRIFSTECHCKNETKIVLRKEDTVYRVNYLKRNYLEKSYTLTNEELEGTEFTCEHYNSFKRGKNQKIIGYALYGTGSLKRISIRILFQLKLIFIFYKGHLFYYNFVNLARTAKILYPGWLLRVYYDSTIDPWIKCKIECLTENENSEVLLDNVSSQ